MAYILINILDYIFFYVNIKEIVIYYIYGILFKCNHIFDKKISIGYPRLL